jgi:hypothetical protein
MLGAVILVHERRIGSMSCLMGPSRFSRWSPHFAGETFRSFRKFPSSSHPPTLSTATMAHHQQSLQHRPLVPDSTKARDIISKHATKVGFESGALAAAIAGSGVLAANTYWPVFRRRLGASGKTALVVSSALATFIITAETQLVAGSRNPEKYLASLDPNFVAEETHDRSSLRWHHRMANTLYDHPYRTLAIVGVPLVGGIFAVQATNHTIQRSQQIMHTRIYGQGAIVVLLLASMGFHDYMRSRGGRFVERDEEYHEKAH